jgi:hypothetical protein
VKAAVRLVILTNRVRSMHDLPTRFTIVREAQRTRTEILRLCVHDAFSVARFTLCFRNVRLNFVNLGLVAHSHLKEHRYNLDLIKLTSIRLAAIAAM